jgi:hypothetical protein
MAAKTKTQSTSSFLKKSRKRRPGVHAKTKISKAKNGSNYKKLYVGQGN